MNVPTAPYWVYAQIGTPLLAGEPGIIDDDEDTLVITATVPPPQGSIKTGAALYQIYDNANRTPPLVGGGLLHCSNIVGQTYTFPF